MRTDAEIEAGENEQTMLIGCACGCGDALNVTMYSDGFINGWSGGAPAAMFTIGKHSVIVQGTPLGTLRYLLADAVAAPAVGVTVETLERLVEQERDKAAMAESPEQAHIHNVRMWLLWELLPRTTAAPALDGEGA